MSARRLETTAPLALAAALLALPAPASLTIVERALGQARAEMGWSVAAAGDVNRDGHADVLVGAPGWDAGGGRVGAVFLYLGSAAGVSTTPAWTVTGGQVGELFGWSVAGVGDVDGDGWVDAVVGAPGHDAAAADEGRATLFRGGPAGLSTTPAWSVTGGQGGAQFGWSVAAVGLTDGDARPDVLVGVPGWNGVGSDVGRALLFQGVATGLSGTPTWVVESDSPGSRFGAAVATAGDVNGDGHSDFAVGAPGHSGSATNQGRVQVFHGGPTGPSTTASWTRDGSRPNVFLGASVAAAGDIDRDGRGDLLVGAWSSVSGDTFFGLAQLYLGSGGGLGTLPAWEVTSTESESAFGCSLAGQADVDRDGYVDVVVGERLADGSTTDEGRAVVHFGGPNGISSRKKGVTLAQVQSFLGHAVASVGDVNADGRADLAAGAPWATVSADREGQLVVILGGS